MRQRAIINWGISSFFGWGVYGLNLALAWADDPAIEGLSAIPISPDAVAVDPLRKRALEPFFAASRGLVDQLAAVAGSRTAVDVPVLAALGNDFKMTPAAHGVHLGGNPDIGVVFFEIPQLDAETIERAKGFRRIVCGSTWNEKILREYGLDNVTTVIQGIDPTQFHPASRGRVMGGKFKIFSGGKLELRKGQDIVMDAFAKFAKRHPDAVLVTAWHSPWPQFARTLDISGRAAPVVFGDDGKVDVAAWAAANGIPSHQIMDLGAVPNAQMPALLREMDVALFPNRSEGGTNLVAMECMAAGVPTILSANTGHLDLIEPDVCYPLWNQTAVSGFGAGVGNTAGWGDSSTEEVLALLEQVYADRFEAERRGLAGARKLAEFTWGRTARAMRDIVLSEVAATRAAAKPAPKAEAKDAKPQKGRKAKKGEARDGVDLGEIRVPESLVKYGRLETFFGRLWSDVYPETPTNLHSNITAKVWQRVKDTHPLPRGARVLDIGCGQGVALEHFAKDGLKATGIALGEDVAICRKRGFDVVEMDLNFLDFEDASFDLVWCRHVLEHSIMPYFALSEVYRVLKPGGILYMEVPAPDTAAFHERNPNHYSVFGERMWMKLIERTGFRDIVAFDVNFQLSMGPDRYLSFIQRRPSA